MPSSPEAGGRAPFGDAEVDPALFPSLRSVGSGIPARASAAFVAAFRGLLDGSPLQSEVRTFFDRRFRQNYIGRTFCALLLQWLWLELHTHCFRKPFPSKKISIPVVIEDSTSNAPFVSIFCCCCTLQS
jgi:hypothetical protein